MTISPNEAGAMLADVDAIVARVKQSRIYRLTGALLILWGAIVVAGDLFGFVWPRWSVWAWRAADALGAAASFAMLRAGPDVPRRIAAGAFSPPSRCLSPSACCGASASAASGRASSTRSGRPCSCSATRSPACGSAPPSPRSAWA